MISVSDITSNTQQYINKSRYAFYTDVKNWYTITNTNHSQLIITSVVLGSNQSINQLINSSLQIINL